MKAYLTHVELLIERGYSVAAARKGMPKTIVMPGVQIKLSLIDRFPILTTKKMEWKAIITELLWFLRGDTNIKYLLDNGCNIWNNNAYGWYIYQCSVNNQIAMTKEDFITAVKNLTYADLANKAMLDYAVGDLGMVYGHFWRKGFGMDQFQNLIDNIQSNPTSRYHNVLSWSPQLTNKDLSAQPNCHIYFQVHVRTLSTSSREDLLKRKLGTKTLDVLSPKHLKELLDINDIPKNGITIDVVQRSADYFLGVPFNLSSYAALANIIGLLTNTLPLRMVWNGLDVHLYENHIDLAKMQATREVKPLPILGMQLEDKPVTPIIDVLLNREPWMKTTVNDFMAHVNPNTFQLIDYVSHPAIKGELSTGTLV